MSNSPQSRFWKALELSESFKLSKARHSTPRISLFWLLLPGTAIAVFSYFAIGIDPACGCRGGTAEGKAFVGALQRAQHAYFLDNHTFAPSLEALKVGLPAETEDYRMAMHATKTAAFHYAIPKFDRTPATGAMGNLLQRKVDSKQDLHGVVSAVFVVPTHPPSIQTILCIADTAGNVPLEAPALRSGIPTCAFGTHPLPEAR